MNSLMFLNIFEFSKKKRKALLVKLLFQFFLSMIWNLVIKTNPIFVAIYSFVKISKKDFTHVQKKINSNRF